MKSKMQQKKEGQSIRNKTPDGPKKTSAPLKSIQNNSSVQQKNAERVRNNPVVDVQQQKLCKIFNSSNLEQVSQYAKNPEDEELMAQGKFEKNTVHQQKPLDEEELPVQGKFVGNNLVQRKQNEDEKLPLQSKSKETTQMNKTGMPDHIKNKMEKVFDTDLTDVKVHPNSSKAAKVGALAYTQGHDIHLAPGQYRPDSLQGQKLLGHELAHVVQQRQGRVKPTGEIGGMPVNDNPSLEKEADDMGAKASK